MPVVGFTRVKGGSHQRLQTARLPTRRDVVRFDAREWTSPVVHPFFAAKAPGFWRNPRPGGLLSSRMSVGRPPRPIRAVGEACKTFGTGQKAVWKFRLKEVPSGPFGPAAEHPPTVGNGCLHRLVRRRASVGARNGHKSRRLSRVRACPDRENNCPSDFRSCPLTGLNGRTPERLRRRNGRHDLRVSRNPFRPLKRGRGHRRRFRTAIMSRGGWLPTKQVDQVADFLG